MQLLKPCKKYLFKQINLIGSVIEACHNRASFYSQLYGNDWNMYSKKKSYSSEIMSHQCVMQKRVTFIRWEQSFVAGFVNCKHYIFDIDLTWSPRFDKEQPFITASKISKAKRASQPVCIAVIFAQCPISLNYNDFFVCMFACLLGEHVSVPIHLVSDSRRRNCLLPHQKSPMLRKPANQSA